MPPSPIPGPVVVTKRGKSRIYRQGHPMVYSNAVERVQGQPQPGDLVMVADGAGHAYAYGIFNPHSMYRVRYVWVICVCNSCVYNSCIYIYIYMCVCVCVYKKTPFNHKHTHTFLYIYTQHIHTYTQHAFLYIHSSTYPPPLLPGYWSLTLRYPPPCPSHTIGLLMWCTHGCIRQCH